MSNYPDNMTSSDWDYVNGDIYGCENCGERCEEEDLTEYHGKMICKHCLEEIKWKEDEEDSD